MRFIIDKIIILKLFYIANLGIKNKIIIINLIIKDKTVEVLDTPGPMS